MFRIGPEQVCCAAVPGLNHGSLHINLTKELTWIILGPSCHAEMIIYLTN